MGKPVTPLVGCEVFVLNEKGEVLLIQRADEGLWAHPGGCQNLNETPKQTAERECFEESGYRVEVTELIGIFSSRNYPYVHYKWKDNQFCHLFFLAKLVGGKATPSAESPQVGWFSKDGLPPLMDGHAIRLEFAFKFIRDMGAKAHFE